MRLDNFTEAECENYRHGCNFTDGELAVFDLRVKGKSRVEISMSLAISIATTDRRLRGIYEKVNKVKESGF
jgi:DNA-binding NarL/FixJ family response regulator